ncbi:MAG TPA: hypothetical protein VJN18_12050 [Polyangiaceae bacterium]|nr:hypothetical protein [Polyangiaceae bacterium]
MTSARPRRPGRARSGLRPAAGKQAPPSKPAAAPKQPPLSPLGEERSRAPGKSRDGRHAHDKDGNAQAKDELKR